jgi:hypothetical protein
MPYLACIGKLHRLLAGLIGRYIRPDMNDKPIPTLKELYPHLDEKELLQVEDTLDRYLALVMRIFDRVALQQIHKGRLTQPEDTLR